MFWIILGTTLVLALFFGVLWLMDKKHGDKGTVGVLKMMAHYKATTMIDCMQRRIR